METARIEYGEIKPANGGLYGLEVQFDATQSKLKTFIGAAGRTFDVKGGTFNTQAILEAYKELGINPVLAADLENPVSGIRTTITKALGSKIGVM